VPATEPLPTLTGPRLVLRPAASSDVPALTEVLREPEVARWWGDNDEESVAGEIGAADAFAILVEGAVAGLVLVDESVDPMYPGVGLDIALSARWHGQGYGREALGVVVRHYIGRGHHRFTIDPAAANERAIRVYATLGFKVVGVLRRYERAPDGTFRDGLLMDLLAEELAP
jgi:aminoglycoside 6'-N-acetyltransferase